MILLFRLLLVFVSLIEKIYETLETVFHRLSKHLKFHQKYSAVHYLFNSLLLDIPMKHCLSCLIWYKNPPLGDIQMHDEVCLPLPTIAKCSSSFVFASTVSSILFSNARFTAWHWAWRSLKVCMRIPSIMLRRFMAEFFSRSALRMFLLEKSSHSSGVTELIRSKK